MACEDVETISEAILTAAGKPLEVSGDAGSVKHHSLKDLIEYEKYLASKCAATRSRRGIRLTRMIPDGAE